jgi:uncharacterized membrane protein YqjE
MNNLTQYLETRVELVKLELKEEVAKLLANAFVILLIAFVGFFFLLLLSIGLAVHLGSLWGELSGYLAVSSFYLVVGAGVAIFRKPIVERLEKNLMELNKHKKKS